MFKEIANFLLVAFCFNGVYEAIRDIWIYVEMELTGKTVERTRDTIITAIFSIIIIIVLFLIAQ